MLRGILDRMVLVAAIVAAACIPSFIAQYRQHLAGRLQQVLQDLSLFQQIADRYHHGNLQALITHHLASPDPTFHDEGAAIQAMLQTAQHLRASLQALNADLLHQLQYLIPHADPQMARATWDIYVPSFTLNAQSVVFAIVVGLAIWLVFLAVWQLIASLLRPRKSSHGRQNPYVNHKTNQGEIK